LWYDYPAMPERVFAQEALERIGQTVVLAGWVNSIRNHGGIIFLDLRDKSSLIQVVLSGELLKDARKLRPEWVIRVRGLVKQRPKHLVNPEIPTGAIEIEGQTLEILGQSEELPFDLGEKKLKASLSTILDYRPLSLRHPRHQAIFRVQETIAETFRKTLKKEGFTEIFPPTIVPSATEGGAEVFAIDYFDKKAFLAQSPQLYKQIMVGVFERVFCLAHAYRAEPSVTTRHLTEYVGLDAEMGFIDSFYEITSLAERLIREIFTAVNEKNPKELKMFRATTPLLPEKEIPKMKLRQAQEIIFGRTGRDCRQEPDLTPEDEKEICQYAKEKFRSELIFITHYPIRKRPFYTYPDPEDPEYTHSFDLLGRGMEWITGGRRINDYQTLLAHIKKWGNKPEVFTTYLQAFKYGMPPEGGFCLGLERITMNILGLKNIREASLFPRDTKRVDIALK